MPAPLSDGRSHAGHEVCRVRRAAGQERNGFRQAAVRAFDRAGEPAEQQASRGERDEQGKI
jgi:hypothetical protein